MTRTNTPHPLELAAVAAIALGWALWTLARLALPPVVALLLLALGWRPAPQSEPVAPASAEASPEPIASPDAVEPLPLGPAVVQACSAAPQPSVAIAAPPLERLTVAELRRLARAAGLPRALSHGGRRADLLAALAPA